jgi:lipopolysaccharide export system permease protein
MKTFSAYLARGIYGRVGFVLLGFVALFALFDFVSELEEIGRGNYRLADALQYILLRLPAMAYELLPIACLIGGLWALAGLAASSEFTVARASGFRPVDALRTIGWTGLPLVVACALLSEWVVPFSENLGNRLRAEALGSASVQSLRSGYWLRDALTGIPGPVRERMINLVGASPDQRLLGLVLYEFDQDRRLLRVVRAESAKFESIESQGTVDASVWQLTGVRMLELGRDETVRQRNEPTLRMLSGLSPTTLGALLVKPDQMSAHDLFQYTGYLKSGRQSATRYELAFWKKVFYPLAVWVMLLLALPAAYLLSRGGTVGLKVFVGVLLGVAFHLLNSLFSHLGVLNTWPAPVVAAIPTGLALLLAMAMLLRVQRT